jgi:hypothetical protein
MKQWIARQVRAVGFWLVPFVPPTEEDIELAFEEADARYAHPLPADVKPLSDKVFISTKRGH